MLAAAAAMFGTGERPPEMNEQPWSNGRWKIADNGSSFSTYDYLNYRARSTTVGGPHSGDSLGTDFPLRNNGWQVVHLHYGPTLNQSNTFQTLSFLPAMGHRPMPQPGGGLLDKNVLMISLTHPNVSSPGRRILALDAEGEMFFELIDESLVDNTKTYAFSFAYHKPTGRCRLYRQDDIGTAKPGAGYFYLELPLQPQLDMTLRFYGEHGSYWTIRKDWQLTDLEY